MSANDDVELIRLRDAGADGLLAAFRVDAHEFLAQFTQGLRPQPLRDDTLQGLGNAAEALRGIRIGADFLGLDGIGALCRQGEQDLLQQLPLVAAGRPLRWDTLRAVVDGLQRHIAALGNGGADAAVRAESARSAPEPGPTAPSARDATLAQSELPIPMPTPDAPLSACPGPADAAPPEVAPNGDATEEVGGADVVEPATEAAVAPVAPGDVGAAAEEVPAIEDSVAASAEMDAEAEAEAEPGATAVDTGMAQPPPAVHQDDPSVIEVWTARVGCWTVALRADAEAEPMADGVPMWRGIDGSGLVVDAIGAVPTLDLRGCWSADAGVAEAAGANLLIRHADAEPFALRVDALGTRQTLVFWRVPAHYASASGIGAIALSGAPWEPQAEEAVLLLDAGWLHGRLGRRAGWTGSAAGAGR